MKTFDGRDIPMWEVKTSQPVRCPYCKEDKPLTSRAYTFQTVQTAIDDRTKVPWVPLCDEHRYPEMVDYLYLTNREPVPGYVPSLLCGSIHVMPVVVGLHWCHECSHHICTNCGKEWHPQEGIGQRVIGCTACGDNVVDCVGCRMASVYLGDPDKSFFAVPMLEWVWDRLLKGTILEAKQRSNFFEADLALTDNKDEPALFFTLTEGGRQFRLHDVGVGLLNYMLKWRPVPRFDQAGHALDPWVYTPAKQGKFGGEMVGMAYMSEDNTAIATMSFPLDLSDMSDEEKEKTLATLKKFQDMLEGSREAAQQGG